MPYTHVLVAVDQSDDRLPLLAKARALALDFGARLSVVSVMAPVPLTAYAGDIGMPMSLPMSIDPELSRRLEQETRTRLQVDCAPLGITDADVHLVLGSADSAIVDTAKHLAVDLIVIGHHQHASFFSRLFSHTDQSVVGRAPCDVLAVVLPRAA